MYDSIWVPIDRSDTADRAVELAATYATKLHVRSPNIRARITARTLQESKLATERKPGSQVRRQCRKTGRRARTRSNDDRRTVITQYAADHRTGLIALDSTGADDITEKLINRREVRRQRSLGRCARCATGPRTQLNEA